MSSKSRRAGILGTLAIVVLALAGNLPAYAGDYREEFHKSYPLTADGRVSLKNINGGVTITGWDKNEIQVDAVKTANEQSKLADAKIEVTAGSSSIDIRTHYPDRTNNNPASVEYTLHVPRKARIDKLDLVNGRIKIDGIEGMVRASSVNGSVEATNVGGEVNLNSVNGRVYADLSAPKRSIDLETVNGSVELRLPSDAAAEINASTVHGGINNEFNIPVNRERWVGSELRARLGDGGPAVKLSAVNGGIQIRRASDGKPLSKVTNLLPEDKSRYY